MTTVLAKNRTEASKASSDKYF